MTPLPRFAPAPLAHLIVVTARSQLALRTQRMLITAGYSVEVAGTLRRGLAILHHRPPDGMVLDGEIRNTHPADYATLIAAAREAQMALVVLGEPAVEPALLAREVGGPASATSPSLFTAALVERLCSHDLSAEAAVGKATYAPEW